MRPPPVSAPVPPLAPRRPTRLELHGHVRVDDYFWLRDRNDPEVAAYLEAENRYAETIMAPTTALQQTLYREMVGHIRETDLTVPYREGDFFYYARTEEGKQYPIYCRRREALDAPEKVTLDVNALARGKEFMAIGDYAVSDDGALLAYSTDETGDRSYTLRVKDLRTGGMLPDRVEDTAADSLVWAADGKTLFYAMVDAAKRPWRFYRRVLGEAAGELVYEETDERFDVGAYRSRSGRFVFLLSGSHTSSEVRFLEASAPRGEFRLIAARDEDHEYDVDHREDLFYVRTNGRDASGRRAPNFRVVVAPAADPRRESWREIVPERADVMIEGIDCFAGHVVRYERERGLPRVVVTAAATGESHAIPFDEEVYAIRPSGNREYRTAVLRYDFESLVTPASIYDYDMDARRAELRKATVVPGYDPALYEQRRIDAVASDGARIPISLVHRKDVPRDGSAPMDLWGYGSYGLNFPIRFDPARLALLDRGFVFAAAHIRGGAELGKRWHEDGRMARKMNTFTDFIAAAEHLIALGYTSAEKLVAEGRSAGGLLMGAVINLRPDLFRAIVTAVPFVDVLSTMLDPSLPLTVTEYEEWGNPNEAEAYHYMRRYSPYDNVDARAYPAMLVKTALNDSQVPYWEPAKLVAKLRAVKTDDRALLLKTNMSAGHGGASGRYDSLRERALDVAFILRELSIED
ncbi:MAG TPA: S9 family peptidase [Thermoanaerobaculia bacterium]|nr:S9 family peptidase [Thermoanaerobaculia bacterium]